MSGSSISWAICKSASRSRQITMPAPHHSSFFTVRMPFLPPNQQRQSTEGKQYLLSKKATASKSQNKTSALRLKMSHLGCTLVRHFEPHVHHIYTYAAVKHLPRWLRLHFLSPLTIVMYMCQGQTKLTKFPPHSLKGKCCRNYVPVTILMLKFH